MWNLEISQKSFYKSPVVTLQSYPFSRKKNDNRIPKGRVFFVKRQAKVPLQRHANFQRITQPPVVNDKT